MTENNVKSPFIEQPGFDYDKLRIETTLPAMKAVYKVIAENADNIIFGPEASEEAMNNGISDAAQAVLKVILENKVPEADMQYLISIIEMTISSIFKKISRQKSELEKEYLARCIGVRDPGTGKYTREYATMTDMFAALEKIRNEQDVDGNQYFITK